MLEKYLEVPDTRPFKSPYMMSSSVVSSPACGSGAAASLPPACPLACGAVSLFSPSLPPPPPPPLSPLSDRSSDGASSSIICFTKVVLASDTLSYAGLKISSTAGRTSSLTEENAEVTHPPQPQPPLDTAGFSEDSEDELSITCDGGGVSTACADGLPLSADSCTLGLRAASSCGGCASVDAGATVSCWRPSTTVASVTSFTSTGSLAPAVSVPSSHSSREGHSSSFACSTDTARSILACKHTRDDKGCARSRASTLMCTFQA
mmetsp:Transcript_5697/g.14473  ORF Transcript_5697/g.14473 Transcript_5697/m.14473 type:complete len:263 (+) Transcript_5697:1443-2231(+)